MAATGQRLAQLRDGRVNVADRIGAAAKIVGRRLPFLARVWQSADGCSNMRMPFWRRGDSVPGSGNDSNGQSRQPGDKVTGGFHWGIPWLRKLIVKILH